MNKLILIPVITVSTFMLVQCTYNCSFVNANGTNSDLIDETSTPTTSVDTALSAPLM